MTEPFGAKGDSSGSTLTGPRAHLGGGGGGGCPGGTRAGRRAWVVTGTHTRVLVLNALVALARLPVGRRLLFLSSCRGDLCDLDHPLCCPTGGSSFRGARKLEHPGEWGPDIRGRTQERGRPGCVRGGRGGWERQRRTDTGLERGWRPLEVSWGRAEPPPPPRGLCAAWALPGQPASPPPRPLLGRLVHTPPPAGSCTQPPGPLAPREQVLGCSLSSGPQAALEGTVAAPAGWREAPSAPWCWQPSLGSAALGGVPVWKAHKEKWSLELFSLKKIKEENLL